MSLHIEDLHIEEGDKKTPNETLGETDVKNPSEKEDDFHPDLVHHKMSDSLIWIDDEGTHSESINMENNFVMQEWPEHAHSIAKDITTEDDHSDVHCPVRDDIEHQEIKEHQEGQQEDDSTDDEDEKGLVQPTGRGSRSQTQPGSGGSRSSNSSTGRQSLIVRMRKSIRSKSISSRFGRKAISMIIGPAGVSLLHNFKAAALRDKGEKYAKQLKRRVLRTAIKVHMVIKSKTISLDRLSHLNTLALHIMRGLQGSLIPPTMDSAAEEIPKDNIEALVELFSQFTVELVIVFGAAITPKNLGKAKDTLNYWGGRHFLTLLLNNPHYQDENIASHEAITHMLEESHTKNRSRVASIVES